MPSDLLLERLETPVARLLAGRELLHGQEELAGDRLHRPEHEGPVDHPVVVGVRVFVGLFERIAPQVEEQRHAQLDHGLAPHLQLFGAVLQVGRLPVAHADGHDVAVVAHVDERLARRVLRPCR